MKKAPLRRTGFYRTAGFYYWADSAQRAIKIEPAVLKQRIFEILLAQQ